MAEEACRSWEAVLKHLKRVLHDKKPSVTASAAAAAAIDHAFNLKLPRTAWKKLVRDVKVPLKLSKLLHSCIYLQHSCSCLFVSALGQFLQAAMRDGVIDWARPGEGALVACMQDQVTESHVLRVFPVLLTAAVKKLAVEAAPADTAAADSSSSSSSSNSGSSSSSSNDNICKLLDEPYAMLQLFCSLQPLWGHPRVPLRVFMAIAGPASNSVLLLALSTVQLISQQLSKGQQQQQQQQQEHEQCLRDSDAPLFKVLQTAMQASVICLGGWGSIEGNRSAFPDNPAWATFPRVLDLMQWSHFLPCLANTFMVVGYTERLKHWQAAAASDSSSSSRGQASSAVQCTGTQLTRTVPAADISAAAAAWRLACSKHTVLPDSQQLLADLSGCDWRVLLWAAASGRQWSTHFGDLAHQLLFLFSMYVAEVAGPRVRLTRAAASSQRRQQQQQQQPPKLPGGLGHQQELFRALEPTALMLLSVTLIERTVSHTWVDEVLLCCLEPLTEVTQAFTIWRSCPWTAAVPVAKLQQLREQLQQRGGLLQGKTHGAGSEHNPPHALNLATLANTMLEADVAQKLLPQVLASLQQHAQQAASSSNSSGMDVRKIIEGWKAPDGQLYTDGLPAVVYMWECCTHLLLDALNAAAARLTTPTVCSPVIAAVESYLRAAATATLLPTAAAAAGSTAGARPVYLSHLVLEGITECCLIQAEATGRIHPRYLMLRVWQSEPGSPEQVQVFSLLCTVLKLCRTFAARPPPYQTPRAIELCRVCAEALAKVTCGIYSFLTCQLAMVDSQGHMLRQQHTAAHCASAGSSSSSSSAGGRIDKLPWVVLFGRCCLAFPRQLQGLTAGQVSVLIKGSTSTPVNNIADAFFKPVMGGWESSFDVIVHVLLGWLEGGAAAAQLAACGYNAQPVKKQLQAAVSALAAVRVAAGSPAEFGGSMVVLAQEVKALGKALTALPFPDYCNNPSCSNVSGASETVLVTGKSCKCGGCRVAHYCSRDCQRQHWKQHKPVCQSLAEAASGAQAGAASVVC